MVAHCSWASYSRLNAQGKAWHNYLIFLVIYHVLLWHDWRIPWELYGNLTQDAVLASHIQICYQLNKPNKMFIFTKVISFVFIEFGMVGFSHCHTSIVTHSKWPTFTALAYWLVSPRVPFCYYELLVSLLLCISLIL